MVFCTAKMKYDELTMFVNFYAIVHELQYTEFECEAGMMEDRHPKQIFYLLDAKQLCQTVQYMAVPYCTTRMLCGASRAFDAYFGSFYALFQFKANGFFQQSGQGDCPVGSSDIGRALNPNIRTTEFNYKADPIFVRDVCDQYRQPRTFPVAKETQDFIDLLYAGD
ncbi:hypothetical protein M3Y99_01937000 [Aphelenchoides fujianensis]|nr:hypothetical protein M3Y99_01937000 [Aphelenchoides fujianensis]